MFWEKKKIMQTTIAPHS